MKNFHGKFWIWINLYFCICVFEILATKNPWPETLSQNFVSVSKDVFEFYFVLKVYKKFWNNVFLMFIYQLGGVIFLTRLLISWSIENPKIDHCSSCCFLRKIVSAMFGFFLFFLCVWVPLGLLSAFGVEASPTKTIVVLSSFLLSFDYIFFLSSCAFLTIASLEWGSVTGRSE